MKLTDEQQQILKEAHQNIYISAAPGSGKSTMLSFICDKLLKDKDNYVMLVTFTNKAAKSILKKCGQLNAQRIVGGTFHSLGYKLQKENGVNKTICDENKKRLIIKSRFNIKDREELEDMLDHVDRVKNTWPLVEDQDVHKYNLELDKYNLMDFDDIILDTIEMLGDNTIIVPPVTHILVDELQDTSGHQLEMLKALQKRLGCNMIGVADDDQSIYKWRGARQENVQDFINCFGCKILNMGYNFRSATSIVECSKRVIEKNQQRISKTIRAFRSDKGIVRKYGCQHHLREIDYVVGKCMQYDDEIAILYRTRLFKNHLEFELKKAHIPYRVNDILDLTDRTPVRVMMSCLRIASNEFDVYDLEQACKGLKGLGKTTVEQIIEETKTKGVKFIIQDWLQNKKKHKRLRSIEKLQTYFDTNEGASLEMLVRYTEEQFTQSFNFQDDMRSFLLDITSHYEINQVNIRELYNELGLNAREEENDETARIELSTIHGYKGLEKPIVIVPWSQQFSTPRIGKDFDLEDERRLFYVAITRARDKLFVTYSGYEPQFVKEMGIV